MCKINDGFFQIYYSYWAIQRFPLFDIPKIRKSIILQKEGIFRQTFKLPFSRFHVVFFLNA